MKKYEFEAGLVYDTAIQIHERCCDAMAAFASILHEMGANEDAALKATGNVGITVAINLIQRSIALVEGDDFNKDQMNRDLSAAIAKYCSMTESPVVAPSAEEAAAEWRRREAERN